METYSLGMFEVSFDFNGSINALKDKSGKKWADSENTLGVFSYETFGKKNYDHWFNTYVRELKKNHSWADSDYGKPGFEYAEPKSEHRTYEAIVRAIKLERRDDTDFVQIEMAMPSYPVVHFGAPKSIVVEYRFYKNKSSIGVSLYWLCKDANRLPEASWFSFTPIVDNANQWRLHKIGSYISPLNVVKGTLYTGSEGKVNITTYDAALVCPGERKLLCFDNQFAPLDGGMHFNLYNNIWGTNFPMWYEEDAKFRFELDFKSYF
jgi:hypothetical protein